MARKTAGYRYPHATTDARQHDHTWCPVIGKIADRVAAGTEPWGIPHPMPPIAGEPDAARIRQGLFRGRSCRQVTSKHGQLSVSVMYRYADGTEGNKPDLGPGGRYVLVVRVWDRKTAKREMARRVKNGEQLHYNVLRRN